MAIDCVGGNLQSRARRKRLKPVVLYLLCIVMVVLIMTCFFRRVVVNGQSMEPTLHDHQNLILVSTRWNPLLRASHGDIVVTQWNERLIIKRVIACPGDTIEILDGQVSLNGDPLQEPYILEPMLPQTVSAMTLEDDEYFLMGDNRNNSGDSRLMGTFSHDEFLGIIYLDRQWFLLVGIIGLLSAVVAMTGALEKIEQ